MIRDCITNWRDLQLELIFAALCRLNAFNHFYGAVVHHYWDNCVLTSGLDICFTRQFLIVVGSSLEFFDMAANPSRFVLAVYIIISTVIQWLSPHVVKFWIFLVWSELVRPSVEFEPEAEVRDSYQKHVVLNPLNLALDPAFIWALYLGKTNDRSLDPDVDALTLHYVLPPSLVLSRPVAH